MLRNHKMDPARQVLVLLLASINAIILRTALVHSSEWYLLLVITVPLMIVFLFLRYKA